MNKRSLIAWLLVIGSGLVMAGTQNPASPSFSSTGNNTASAGTTNSFDAISWNSGVSSNLVSSSATITNATVPGSSTIGTLTNSTAFIAQGSIAFKRVQTATNYLVQATDYYIAIKSPSVASQTNTLPASASSGRVLIFKDVSKTAASTNITITAINGATTNTIDGANTSTISVNGGSTTLIFDGTSNWEIN